MRLRARIKIECVFGPMAHQLDSRQQAAVADAGRAEQGAFAHHQVIAAIDPRQILRRVAWPAISASMGFVVEPHADLHVAAQALERGRRQHRFGRAAVADIEVDAGVRQEGATAAVMSPSETIRRPAPACADVANNVGMPRPVERHHHQVAHMLAQRVGRPGAAPAAAACRAGKGRPAWPRTSATAGP